MIIHEMKDPLYNFNVPNPLLTVRRAAFLSY